MPPTAISSIQPPDLFVLTRPDEDDLQILATWHPGLTGNPQSVALATAQCYGYSSVEDARKDNASWLRPLFISIVLGWDPTPESPYSTHSAMAAARGLGYGDDILAARAALHRRQFD